MAKPTAPKSVTPRKPWVEAFRAGTHTDNKGVEHSYTDADISTMETRINAQLAGQFVPPVVLGHPESDSPRVAGVYEALAVGESPRRLYLRMDEATPEFAESVNKGEYKYVSINHYPDLSLRHLGVLGGANPGVKGQEPMGAFGEGIFAEADKGHTADEMRQFSEPMDSISTIGMALMRISWKISSIGNMFSKLRDQEIAKSGSVETADSIYPSYLVQGLTDFDLSDLVADLGDTSGEMPAFTEHSSGVRASAGGGAPPVPGVPPSPGPTGGDALANQVADLQRELRERDSREAVAAFSERLDGLVTAGRLHPSQHKPLLNLFKRTSEAAPSAAYSEGAPAYAELDAILASLPRIVQYGEIPDRPTAPTTNPLIADATSAERHNRS